jgi:hypothetical protein
MLSVVTVSSDAIDVEMARQPARPHGRLVGLALAARNLELFNKTVAMRNAVR